MNDLAEIKQVSLTDLHNFLSLDHTSFTVLSVSTKHIESTNRLSVSLTKNSASSFYLGESSNCKKPPRISKEFYSAYGNLLPETDNCFQDAQNCSYFAFFNSKEKKLYTRFKDKVEANFEGKEAQEPLLFLTLTFNTKHDNYSAFTTNWNPQDPVWQPISQKNNWLKNWAENFDPQAEPFKIKIEKVSEQVQQHNQATYYLTLFLRRIRRLWKPSAWKWTVVSELQKNGIWHFHLLSTPIVPYSHKCTLDKNFTSCWNCRTYLSELWPWGRVESRSPGQKTISSYLAKYLSKSFHLRNLYTQHGLKNNHKTYRFYLNLYDYDQKPVLLISKHKLDAETGQHLPKNQKIFRSYNYETQETSYFYRTNETLVGKCSKPILIKKNYRLGTRSLNPLNLLNLATKNSKKETILWKKPPTEPVSTDFQSFLITRLLLFCHKAEFCHLPLEQNKVPKELEQCNNSVQSHFQTKPIFHFQFAPESATAVLSFINNLDTYAQEYDMEESQAFQDARFADPIESRNAYLNHWALDYFYPSSDNWRRTPM